MKDAPKNPPKPKLTDADRRKRFVEMAKKVEASENLDDLDKVLERLSPKSRKSVSQEPTK
jgi:hypothetical protein